MSSTGKHVVPAPAIPDMDKYNLVGGLDTREQADKEQRAAAERLLELAKKTAGEVNPQEIAKLEKRASMSAPEKLLEIAKDNSPYKDDRMQQRFPSIKSIQAVRGGILVKVDEKISRQHAVDQAIKIYGLQGDQNEVLKYIAEHSSTDTLFTVKKFIRNLRLVARFVAIAPEYFGDARGGSEVRDILRAGWAAVKEARKYLELHNKELPDKLISWLLDTEYETSDKKSFSTYLGEGWEKDVDSKDKLEVAKKITGIVKP